VAWYFGKIGEIKRRRTCKTAKAHVQEQIRETVAIASPWAIENKAPEDKRTDSGIISCALEIIKLGVFRESFFWPQLEEWTRL
jgi:hypothetical protein